MRQRPNLWKMYVTENLSIKVWTGMITPHVWGNDLIGCQVSLRGKLSDTHKVRIRQSLIRELEQEI